MKKERTKENIQLVYYIKIGFVPSTTQGWKGTVYNIPRPKPLEKVYAHHLWKINKPLMLLIEHKILDMMRNLVVKYYQPGEIVYDPFAGSYTTWCTCFVLPLNGRWIIRDMDDDCSNFAKIQSMELFAGQLLNHESNITRTAELEDAARLLLRSLDKINGKKYRNLWSTRPGYPPLTFPPDVVDVLYYIHMYY